MANWHAGGVDILRWFGAVLWWLVLSVAFTFTASGQQIFDQIHHANLNPVDLSMKGELVPAAVALWATGALSLWRERDAVNGRMKWLADIVMGTCIVFAVYFATDITNVAQQVLATTGHVGSESIGRYSLAVFGGAVGTTSLGAVLVAK